MKTLLKKILLLFFVSALNISAYGIEWVKVTAPSGRVGYVDSDSIIETDRYYFYNVKMNSENGKDEVVVTIQSGIRTPFSAKLNFYTIENYEALKGDYENIKAKETRNLQPVTYFSFMYAIYSKVKEIQTLKSRTNITF